MKFIKMLVYMFRFNAFCFCSYRLTFPISRFMICCRVCPEERCWCGRTSRRNGRVATTTMIFPLVLLDWACALSEWFHHISGTQLFEVGHGITFRGISNRGIFKYLVKFKTFRHVAQDIDLFHGVEQRSLQLQMHKTKSDRVYMICSVSNL